MKIAGITIDHRTYADTVDCIRERINGQKCTFLTTPNPEMLLEATDDVSYRQVLNDSDICVPDGIGVLIAYQILDSKAPTFCKYFLVLFWCLRAVFAEKTLHKKYGERITGADLSRSILQIACGLGNPVVILDQKVQEIQSDWDTKKIRHQDELIRSLQSIYPGLEVHLVTCTSEDDAKASIRQLELEHAVMLTTIGGTQQERYTHDILRSDIGVLFGAGVGGSIDLMTGFRESAPEWLRKLGFEWLYRFYKRPNRHAKRIQNVLKFLWLQLKK